MDQASKKLGDTNAQSMHAILSERLKWGGIISDATNPIINGLKPSLNMLFRFVCNPRATIENSIQ